MTRYYEQTREVRKAVLLLMKTSLRATYACERRDWIAYADARTSAEDAREALRIAVAMGAGR